MARTYHLLAALGVTGLLLPVAVWAQSGHRTMIVDRGDGPNVFHVSIPDLRALREPDFIRSDLPVFDDKLALSEAQRPTVEKLLEDYLSAFDLLAVEFLPKAGPMVMGFGDHAAIVDHDHDEAHDGGRGVFVGEGADIGEWNLQADGPGMVAIQIEAGVGGGIVGEDVDVIAGGGDGGPEVAIAVKSAGGVELSEEDRKKLEEKAKEIAERLQAQMEAGEGGEIVLEGVMPGLDALEERKREFEELAERAEQFQGEKESLRVKFVQNVQSQLEDDQLQRWPTLERALTRHKTLPKGRLSGEKTDLVRIIDSMDTGPLDEAAAEQLAAYEIVMHEALLRRNAYIEEANAQVDEALQARDTDRALEVVDRATALRKAVRGVNERFAEGIAQQLDAGTATAFRDKIRRASYPNVYRKTPGLGTFEAARQLEGLQEETLLAILELEGQYRRELDTTNEEIRRTIDLHQPDQTRRSIEHMRQVFDGDGEGFTFGRDEDDPIAAAYDKRRDLERRYVKVLRQMLTPEQAAALPELPTKASRQPFFIRHSADAPK